MLNSKVGVHFTYHPKVAIWRQANHCVPGFCSSSRSIWGFADSAFGFCVTSFGLDHDNVPG